MPATVCAQRLVVAWQHGCSSRTRFSFPFLRSWRQSLDEILGLAAQDLEDRKEKNLQVSWSPTDLFSRVIVGDHDESWPLGLVLAVTKFNQPGPAYGQRLEPVGSPRSSDFLGQA